MSSIQVANINFDSSANNQLVYNANTVTVRAGGVNVFTANSTQFSVLVTANVTPGVRSTTGTITANTISLNSNSNIQVYGQYVLNGTVTPTAINANTSDFAPPVANATVIRFSANSSNNSALSVYGLTGGTNGQIVILSNIGTKVITLQSESPSNANAVNRFSLPQSINLNGYQSVSLYYDGTAARWKPIDYYDNFFYKTGLLKGFFAGGNTPTNVLTADRTTYSTETTAAVAGANLTQARFAPGSAGNACKGFFNGGSTSVTGQVATADRTTYSTEATAAVVGANLSQARGLLGAAGNLSKGFFIGGATPLGGSFATADRTTYSTETTAAVAGANLSQARQQVKAVGNLCKGFFSGGNFPAALATADRTTYATETTAAVTGANLSAGRGSTGSAGNACKGFFSGGRNPALLATADRTTFSTETTAAVTGANLSTSRSGAGSAGNSCKGFFSGGGCAPIGVIADRTTYSTETTAAVAGANLSQARQQIGGL